VHLGIKCGNFGHGFKFVPQANRPKQKSKQAIETRSFYGGVKSEDDSSVGVQGPNHVAVRSMTKSAWHSQTIGIFWDAYAGNRSGLLKVLDATMISQTWMQAAVGESHTDNSLSSALLALSTARLSRLTGYSDLQRQSDLHYSVAVKSLQKALHHPKQRFDDTVLATVMVLGVYEVRARQS
jgi:hypothetical protein